MAKLATRLTDPAPSQAPRYVAKSIAANFPEQLFDGLAAPGG